MKTFILFIVLFSLTALAQDRCSHLTNDCEYYVCIAEEKNCDGKSYPLKFGHKYCLRYTDHLEDFSSEGKEWVDSVRRCLIDEMVKFESEASCSGIKSKAFESHVPCYLKSGFCSLSLKDKKTVVKTIWPSISNIQVVTSGTQVLKECL